MKLLAWIYLLLAAFSTANAEISEQSVAVLYNSAVSESLKLAEIYREARGIPAENLIGLDMPATADISREAYEQKIAKPLRQEFDNRGWWKRQKDGDVIGPITNKIRVMVTMRGVPLRIQPQAIANPKNHPIDDHNEAAVDSELAMFGVETLAINGVLQNKFHHSEKSISEVNLPFMLLTARIDAPTFATCKKMISDAVEVEKSGLWGRAYVDIANKIPQGDQWLENVVKENKAAGIPTIVDRFNETLPKNYPMMDASLYYGWYDLNVSGPFLNSRFKFRKGAVAMHLHSFSSDQLTDSTKNWSGPLLEKGAAVTVGNVYEPYLGLTHDFGLLHQRLLSGFTWVEASWMAMPVTSWQGVVLGDPLYRPFLHLDGGGKKQTSDIEFRALRAAAVEWKDDSKEQQQQLERASERMKSGVLAEAVALNFRENKDPVAGQWFRIAKGNYIKTEDKLRQEFNLIAIDRAENRPTIAIQDLRDAQIHYGSLPEAEALKGWLDVLLPPAGK